MLSIAFACLLTTASAVVLGISGMAMAFLPYARTSEAGIRVTRFAAAGLVAAVAEALVLVVA